jgi:hypothetical protein
MSLPHIKYVLRYCIEGLNTGKHNLKFKTLLISNMCVKTATQITAIYFVRIN